MKKIAILASGNGSNAENIIKFFENNETVKVSMVITNNSKAFVLERAKKLNVPAIVFDNSNWKNGEIVLRFLKKNEIDFIVLAGFLRKIPESIVNAYPRRIINIHPALLPHFGGKGMYGDRVHKEVIINQEKETGITIHFVDADYDSGAIIFQAKCPVKPEDSVEVIAGKVHELEYKFYPQIIEQVVLS